MCPTGKARLPLAKLRFPNTPYLKHVRAALSAMFAVPYGVKKLVENSFISLWHADAFDSRHDRQASIYCGSDDSMPQRIETERQQSNSPLVEVEVGYLNELLEVPKPSRLKSILKLVFFGLTSCLRAKVTVQHSQNERNLLVARKPMKRLSRTS